MQSRHIGSSNLHKVMKDKIAIKNVLIEDHWSLENKDFQDFQAKAQCTIRKVSAASGRAEKASCDSSSCNWSAAPFETKEWFLRPSMHTWPWRCLMALALATKNRRLEGPWQGAWGQTWEQIRSNSQVFSFHPLDLTITMNPPVPLEIKSYGTAQSRLILYWYQVFICHLLKNGSVLLKWWLSAAWSICASAVG